MTDLHGKTALVTGSAGGIGRAIALRYASLGARVIVNYAHGKEAALATVEDIRALGAEAIAVQADVSDLNALEDLFQQAVAAFGKLDIVVANAGVEIVDQLISEVTEEQFDRLFAVNAKGTFFTLQKAARYIADHGRIINIGSSTTAMVQPGVGLYGSSKMAARYAVEVLALEVGARGVTVNSIIPTAIEGAGVFTEVPEDHPLRALLKSGRPLEGRFGTVDDVADAAEYFAGPLARWISGQHLLVSGGAPA
ncbi:SDR family NAD(P)-dependent oxidoreductase [Kribbella shirazensis]|uniref:3-oxoacyl-[acyl-carrier protein] reductase n=1 Tax=Kribbella shirazensis TaxID=1105143 RepID=A0A7X5V9J0_9ACTN|nr:SDR family oxidoreductase [Kribbella shirazensis]NIK57120.1 3-oxoacyl-[acyl-carrier protein] reductase [Kribbella shirazensis]